MLNWLRKYTDPLCEVSGDKYAHLLACQLIAFIVGKGLSFVMNKYVSALIGLVVAVVFGLFKEIDDEAFDYDDFKADVLGAAWGALYCLV